MIHIYTGEGKGKTTAALGLSIRAAGRDKKVLFVQFLKGQETGEQHILRLIPQITHLKLANARGFFIRSAETSKSTSPAKLQMNGKN